MFFQTSYQLQYHKIQKVSMVFVKGLLAPSNIALVAPVIIETCILPPLGCILYRTQSLYVLCAWVFVWPFWFFVPPVFLLRFYISADSSIPLQYCTDPFIVFILYFPFFPLLAAFPYFSSSRSGFCLGLTP